MIPENAVKSGSPEKAEKGKTTAGQRQFRITLQSSGYGVAHGM